MYKLKRSIDGLSISERKTRCSNRENFEFKSMCEITILVVQQAVFSVVSQCSLSLKPGFHIVVSVVLSYEKKFYRTD